jgi:pimeloyl-ACP methyl ester carboxylesterase
LGNLSVPTILIHGSEDPRTEPGELDRVRQLLPEAPLYLVAGGEHCPHAEPAVFEQVNRIAEEFLSRIAEREQR